MLLPAALSFTRFALAAAVYLSFVGLAVPVAVLERTGFRASLRRALQLGRADWIHALGSIAALVVVYALLPQSLLDGQAGHRAVALGIRHDLVPVAAFFLGRSLRLGLDERSAAEP